MDPVTLAALGGGSTLASMFLNSSAQSSVDKARANVINGERARQAAFDAETGKLNDQSLGRYVNFDTQMSDRAKQLSDLYKAPVITPNTQYTAAPLPPVSSDLVAREVNTKNNIADAYVNHQADALGNLRSFGDLFGTISRGQARDAQLIGQIGGFKKGSSAVEQLELDNANRAGNEQKMWADLSGGIGKVGLTAALAGQYEPPSVLNPDGSIGGAEGPTSVGGRPLVGHTARFGANATPFLTYGR
jgi:hypothetical protein